jgi:WD repeat-containing protein 68
MADSENRRRKEIYTYNAPWPIYSMNWSVRPDQKFRLAVGSILEDYTNKVDIVQLNEESGEFETKGSFDHPYPATKIMWNPNRMLNAPDLLATTGDYLRLWEVKPDKQKVEMKHLLNNVRGVVRIEFSKKVQLEKRIFAK